MQGGVDVCSSGMVRRGFCCRGVESQPEVLPANWTPIFLGGAECPKMLWSARKKYKLSIVGKTQQCTYAPHNL